MDTHVLDYLLARLRVALEHNDLGTATAIIESMRPADQADVFSELDDETQVGLLPELNPADSANILEKLHDEEAAELVKALPTDAVIRIVDEMEPDEAADLLGDLHPDQAQVVLAGLEDAKELRPLLVHPDDSAGGLMTTEFLALRRWMTAGEAIQAVREWQPEPEAVYYLFVVDRAGRLSGVVGLRELIIADPDTPLSKIMDPEVISVPAGADREECAQLMSRYDLLALPVVDDNGVLLGVVTIDDVVDVLVEAATEDMQRFGGAEPLERPYLDMGVLGIFRRRVVWLLLLFVAASLTGSVLRYFQSELEAVVALTFFIPLLVGTGGNAGSQTTSTLVRALGMGEIDSGDALRTLWHELRTGLILGLAMGVVAYVRAITWVPSQALALTVSLSIVAIVVWASTLGSLLPLLVARLRIDPAAVSGPVMSTLVDATGLLFYFTAAKIILGL
ncbi:MAG TPA: magnesium transporter [Chloroflexi bacterium]|nr:magnesium transporter [Chloroflexota bacterium]